MPLSAVSDTARHPSDNDPQDWRLVDFAEREKDHVDPETKVDEDNSAEGTASAAEDVEVVIQDAEGQIARMTIKNEDRQTDTS